MREESQNSQVPNGNVRLITPDPSSAFGGPSLGLFGDPDRDTGNMGGRTPGGTVYNVLSKHAADRNRDSANFGAFKAGMDVSESFSVDTRRNYSLNVSPSVFNQMK